MQERIWFNPEHGFLGATGYPTVADLARAIAEHENRDYAEVLVGGFDHFAENIDATAVERALIDSGVRAMLVPDNTFTDETWDSAEVIDIAVDDLEHRLGYIRVLGVNL